MNQTQQENFEHLPELLRQTYLGTFKVPLAQLTPHPAQRALDRPAAKRIAEQMKISDQRYENPLLGVLDSHATSAETTDVLARLIGGHAESNDVPLVPSNIALRIFSGQHRVEALRLLEQDDAENYWPVRIYQSRTVRFILFSNAVSHDLAFKGLETAAPASFVANMLLLNSQSLGRSVSRADQWMGMRNVYRVTGGSNVPGLLERLALALPDTDAPSEGPGTALTATRAFRRLCLSDSFAPAIDTAMAIPCFADAFTPTGWAKLLEAGDSRVATTILLDSIAQMKVLSEDPAHLTEANVYSPMILPRGVPRTFNGLRYLLTKYGRNKQAAMQQAAKLFWKGLGSAEDLLQALEKGPSADVPNMLTDADRCLFSKLDKLLTPSVLSTETVTTALSNYRFNHTAFVMLVVSNINRQGSQKQSHVPYLLDALEQQHPTYGAEKIDSLLMGISQELWQHREVLRQDWVAANIEDTPGLKKPCPATAQVTKLLSISKPWRSVLYHWTDSREAMVVSDCRIRTVDPNQLPESVMLAVAPSSRPAAPIKSQPPAPASHPKSRLTVGGDTAAGTRKVLEAVEITRSSDKSKWKAVGGQGSGQLVRAKSVDNVASPTTTQPPKSPDQSLNSKTRSVTFGKSSSIDNTTVGTAMDVDALESKDQLNSPKPATLPVAADAKAAPFVGDLVTAFAGPSNNMELVTTHGHRADGTLVEVIDVDATYPEELANRQVPQPEPEEYLTRKRAALTQFHDLQSFAELPQDVREESWALCSNLVSRQPDEHLLDGMIGVVELLSRPREVDGNTEGFDQSLVQLLLTMFDGNEARVLETINAMSAGDTLPEFSTS